MLNELDTQNLKDSKLCNDVNNGQTPSQNVTSYRGFSSIDQEMEREIAMLRFNPDKKSRFSHASFLLKTPN